MIEIALLGSICLLGMVVLILMGMAATSVRIVPEYRRLAVYRLGRYLGERGPGVVFLIPFIDQAISIDEASKAQAYQQMFGATGETRTLVHTDGSVEFDGKLWSAISAQPIQPGMRVRVTKVILEVESI